MMMIAHYSLAHQEEGAQGEGEEEAEDQRKGDQTGIPMSGANAPTGLSWSGVLDSRNRIKHGQWYEVPIHRIGRGG